MPGHGQFEKTPSPLILREIRRDVLTGNGIGYGVLFGLVGLTWAGVLSLPLRTGPVVGAGVAIGISTALGIASIEEGRSRLGRSAWGGLGTLMLIAGAVAWALR